MIWAIIVTLWLLCGLAGHIWLFYKKGVTWPPVLCLIGGLVFLMAVALTKAD